MTKNELQRLRAKAEVLRELDAIEKVIETVKKDGRPLCYKENPPSITIDGYWIRSMWNVKADLCPRVRAAIVGVFEEYADELIQKLDEEN